MLAASRLPEEVHGGGMWFPGQEKLWWATDPASAVASARTEQLARAREEMLGLLADLPESEHELSFSDLIVVTDQDKTSGDVVDTEVASAAGGDGQPAADHDQHDRPDAEASTMEVKNFDFGVSKRRRSSRSGGGGASRSEQPVLLKQNRIGSGHGVGGEGVLLNLYMPCSLTRSLTTGSSSSRSSTRERAAACTAPISEEAQTAKWGCWSSIWATKAKQQNKKGNPSSTIEEKGKSDSHKNKKKKKVQSDRRASSGALV